MDKKQDLISQITDDEHMKELRRRANVLKYFEGAGDLRSTEGFGYLLGGALCLLMGAFVFPMVFGGQTDTGVEKYLFWIMTACGAWMLLKGVFLLSIDSKKPIVQISDDEFAEIRSYDLAVARTAAEHAIRQMEPEATEIFHLTGPNYYTANRHIPILWKKDGAGIIRYSNIAMVSMVVSNERVFAHTCILNHRDGILSKPNTFQYEKEVFLELSIERREIERLTSEHKIEDKTVEMLLFHMKERDDINELSVILSDAGIEKKYGGLFDQSETRGIAQRLAESLSRKLEEKID